MLQEGAVIGGRYRLSKLIGEGGMASVWRAEDGTLARPVAIKLLYVRSHRDPQSIVDQFLREARLAASVQHRNVIHTVDFGVTPDHTPFMVMELLDGESLADRMVRSPALRMEEVVHVASLTLRGLSAVHEAGIVHRDLKPQNIFLQRDAESMFPKILDFGISRSLGSGPQSAIATQQGMIVGTPEYMAPEQARGDADIDKRADIYAMGVILYEGITGRVPFEASSLAELIVKIVSTTAPPMRALRPDVPPLLADCIARALSHDRAARFADAGEFRRALTSAAERSFGSAAHTTTSDSPREHLPLAVLQSPANTQVSAQPMAAASSASSGAWGGFAELEARPAARMSSPRHPAVSVPTAAAQPLGPGAAVAPPRSVTARSPSRGEALQVVHDDQLFGDDPLDGFGSQGGSLELDVSGPAVPRMAGVAAQRRANAESTAPPARAARSRRTPSAAIWVLPLILVTGLLLLLFAPGLFSLPVPDEAPAKSRQEQNPATHGGDRFGDSKPRPKLGSARPALRDVTF
jgi:serine/threonine protein kinase